MATFVADGIPHLVAQVRAFYARYGATVRLVALDGKWGGGLMLAAQNKGGYEHELVFQVEGEVATVRTHATDYPMVSEYIASHGPERGRQLYAEAAAEVGGRMRLNIDGSDWRAVDGPGWRAADGTRNDGA